MHEVAPEGFKIRKPVGKRAAASAAAAAAAASSSAISADPQASTSGSPSTSQFASSSHQGLPDLFQPSSASSPSASSPAPTPIALAGPNEKWCADHHSKLSKIGMEIYGIRDKASGKWLGLWAIPNERVKPCLAYLYLCVVEAYGGRLDHISVPFLDVLAQCSSCRYTYAYDDGVWSGEHRSCRVRRGTAVCHSFLTSVFKLAPTCHSLITLTEHFYSRTLLKNTRPYLTLLKIHSLHSYHQPRLFLCFYAV